MTNLDINPISIMIYLAGFILGLLSIAFIFKWSRDNKQNDLLKSLLIFICGTIVMFSIDDRIQESILTLSILGISFTIAYLITKNVRYSSISTYVGIIFFNGFELVQRAGTEGFYGPTFNFDTYLKPRILILLFARWVR